MILVDSSVWIDVLHDRATAQTAVFKSLLADRLVLGLADLGAVEVLQGTRSEHDFQSTRATFEAFHWIAVVDTVVAVEAARNYRMLRGLGITIRKTIDTLIATRCILDNMPLLYSDRDFDPFVQHLGLRSAMGDAGVS